MNDSRRTRLVLVLLLLASFALITVDFRGGESSPLDRLRGIGSAVFGPVEQVAARVVRPVSGTIQGLRTLPDSRQRIRALEDENSRLRARLHTSELDRGRVAELDKLLGLAGQGRYRILPAQAVAIRGDQELEHTATLDVGSRDGVRRDMTVVNGDGLVGRVTQVGPTTSTVLLALDATSNVGARLEDSMEIGVVRGGGSGPMRFELLDSSVSLKRGERLVTFGSQGGKPYVPGVPIGTVTSVESTAGSLTRVAEVRPFVSFSSLDLVGVVVKPPRKDPRDALLPPKPSATPGPSSTPEPSATPESSPGPEPSSTPEPSSSGEGG